MVTRNGVGVGISAAVLLLAGVLADYPELVILGLAGVAALLVAVVWMLARPQLTTVREIRPQRVSEGSPACAVLTVTNSGKRRSPPLVATEMVAGRRVTVPLPSLAAASSYEAVYPLPTGRRGQYMIPALVIGHSDPLQLLRSGHTHGSESILYVHPRVHHIAPVPTGGPHDMEGPTSSSSPQGGVAFHSLRDYEPGDDWRLIHWKSTARTGTLMVRHNVVPDEPRHLVVLDTSAPPYLGDAFEEAVRIAASLSVAASHAGFPLDFRTTGDRTAAAEQPLGRWASEATAALDALSAVTYSTQDRGLRALTDILSEVVAGDEGVALGVVTGQVSPELLEVLSSLRPQVLTVSLIQVGERVTCQAGMPRGVLTVTSRTSEEFAARWNQLVPQ